MRGHKGAEPGDKAITTRLVPQLVFDSGAIKDLSELNASIDIDSYRLLYLIWGNHQRYSFQNKDMGYLELTYVRNGGKVSARVSKVLVTHDNLNQSVEAELELLDDGLLTPLSYEYTSRITDNALCERPELCLERKGRIEGSRVIEEIKGVEYVRNFTGTLLFDFSIYDLAMRSVEERDFIYFENLYAMKTGNRLDKSDRRSYVEGICLDMMIHRGTALTERRFYKNTNGVPVMMIQNSAAYILDSGARERVERLKSELNSGGFHYEY